MKNLTLKIGTILLMALAGFLFMILLIAASGSPVLKALNSFYRGTFGSLYGLSELFVRSCPLILAALGVSVGLRTGFFNVGAEGQIYIGAAAGTAAALFFPFLPPWVSLSVSVAAGFAAGGLWAAVPGFLKARLGLSEVINTIMLNYIAINIVGILVRTVMKNPDYPLPETPELVHQFKPLVSPYRLHAGLLIALLAAGLVYILFWKSAAGYKLRVVGLAPRAARCSGLSVSRNILAASLISGGLAGIAGISEVLGIHYKLLEGISPGFGYIAIIVALLGRNHPAGIIPAALGMAALQIGSASMQRQAGVPSSVAWIIMGVLVLLILAYPALRRFLRSRI